MTGQSETKAKRLDWATQAAHDAAMSLPPSDFGSTRAVAAVAALLRTERALATGHGQWWPIETAPKDGTQIDLWAVRQVTGEADRYTDCVWARWCWGGEPVGSPRWLGLNDSHSVVTPTHWMPRPAPPATTA